MPTNYPDKEEEKNIYATNTSFSYCEKLIKVRLFLDIYNKIDMSSCMITSPDYQILSKYVQCTCQSIPSHIFHHFI